MYCGDSRRNDGCLEGSKRKWPDKAEKVLASDSKRIVAELPLATWVHVPGALPLPHANGDLLQSPGTLSALLQLL